MRIKLKLYFIEMILETVDWIPLTKDKFEWHAVVNTLTTEWLPSNKENFLNRKKSVSFTKHILFNGLNL